MSSVAMNFSDDSDLTNDEIFINNINDNNKNDNNVDSEQSDYSSSIQVNTDDCVLPVDNFQNNMNKYKINHNFNHNIHKTNGHDEDNHVGNNKGIHISPIKKSYQLKNDNSESNKSNPEPDNQSWLPDILKGESWPEQNNAFIKDVANGIIDINKDPILDRLNNPMLSVHDTILMKNDTYARNNADWKKYKEDDFVKLINNNKLKKLPVDLSPVPNTFANKLNKGQGPSELQLKFFKGQPDTFTKMKLNDMFAQLSPMKKVNTDSNDSSESNGNKLPNVIKQSDDLYNKILTGSSSSSLLHRVEKNEPNENSMSDKNETGKVFNDIDNDADNTQDITSDAEEFSSFPSTTNKIVNDGNKLFQNIRDNYNKNLHLPMSAFTTPFTQSDYTSAEEDNITERSLSRGNAIKGEPTIEQLREQLSSKAQEFNSELNISPPKLQSKFRLNVEHKKNLNSNHNKPTKLNFIPADQYKNKIYDKKLKKFVSKSQLTNNINNNNINNDNINNDNNSSSNYTNNNNNNNNNNNMSTVSNSSYTDLGTQDDTVELPNFEAEKTGNSVINNIPDIVNENQEGSDILEDSFSITDKILVKVINETYPVEDWDSIEELDISGFELERLDHLEKMTPSIWYLNASNNKISQNFGIPTEVQFLNLSFNRFSNISAKFDSFKYLQVLNLSNNELTDLRCLNNLKNLTSLNLSFNKIGNIEYLENFRMLHYLNLSNNEIKGVINFRNYKLWFLEDLIIDDNEIDELINISELPKLINISANSNNLSKFLYYEEDGDILSEDIPLHENLKRISLNNNQFVENIDLNCYPELKEVQLDGNFMSLVNSLPPYTEKLSSRYTSCRSTGVFNENILKFSLHSNHLRTLFLTGGIFPKILPNFKDKFSSVNYLDLSAMNIEKLPNKFSEFFPLLIDLNLNFNKLTNLKGLENLKHLKQLKLLGNEIKEIDNIIEFTSNIRLSLKLIDLRVNPITQEFYPFVFYSGEDESVENIQQNFTKFNLHDREDIEAFSIEYSRLYGPQEMQDWMIKNRKHQRKLPSQSKESRSDYITNIIVWFEHIRYLDGEMLNEIDKRVILQSFGRST